MLIEAENLSQDSRFKDAVSIALHQNDPGQSNVLRPDLVRGFGIAKSFEKNARQTLGNLISAVKYSLMALQETGGNINDRSTDIAQQIKNLVKMEEPTTPNVV